MPHHLCRQFDNYFTCIACRRGRQIDPVYLLPVTHRDDLEPVGGLGAAAANDGAV